MVARIVGFVLVTAICIALIVSCRKEPTEIPPIDYGPAQAEGVLTSTGISLVRRGTHVLSINGKAMYYLESSQLNLQEFDGQSVRITGETQANTQTKVLPVFVVSSIEPLGIGPRQAWRVPALGFTFRTPESWDVQIEGGSVEVTVSGSSLPFLTISKRLTPDMPSQGAPIRIGAKSGIAVTLPDGSEDVFVQVDKDVLLFHFVPPHDDTLQMLKQDFRTTLSTVQFSVSSSSASSVSSITGGSGTLLPCGGAAGILCASGFFCDITDRTQNTGVCRASR